MISGKYQARGRVSRCGGLALMLAGAAVLAFASGAAAQTSTSSSGTGSGGTSSGTGSGGTSSGSGGGGTSSSSSAATNPLLTPGDPIELALFDLLVADLTVQFPGATKAEINTIA